MYISVLEYLEEAVLKASNKVAFSDCNRDITYNELYIYGKKVATKLINNNNKQTNNPIVVYLEKSIECIISFIGIAYSGNFYTPIDVKSPIERVKKIIDVLKPAVIITDRKHQDKLNDLYELSCDIIYIEECQLEQIENKIIDNIQRKRIDTDPLYILFTSGSTGIPKGVTISHRSVIDYIEWVTDTFSITDSTIFGNQAPFYFDNSILDIYTTLKNASTTIIIPEELFIFPRKLIQLLTQKKINTLFWVPSALITVANSGVLNKMELQVDKVLFCGEVMPNKQLNIWRRNIPSALYANLYGPTEITDVCTYYIVDRDFDDNEPLPIGLPCRNTDIIVLNEKNELVSKDEIGELCVRGSSLSLGYYCDENKTNAAFVQNPLNTNYYEKIYKTGDMVRYNKYGELIYLCRKDYQIKHMGHRIELGEIENVAFSVNGIEQCCVLYDEDNKKIRLFCVAAELKEKDIYRKLKDLVPKYMLPSTITIFESMPINANGKVDRVYLNNTYIKGGKTNA